MSKEGKEDWDWRNFTTRNYKTFTFDGGCFIEFFAVREQMWEEIIVSQCEDMIAENECTRMPLPPAPKLRPDIEIIRAADPAAAYELEEQFRRDSWEHVKVTASVMAINKFYDDKVKSIHKIFCDHLGPNVLGLIGNRLNKREFFEAWHELSEFYLKDTVQHSSFLSEIFAVIAYEPKNHTLNQFVTFMLLLFRVQDALDTVPMSESMKVVLLTNAIRKGTKSFRFELDLIRQGGKGLAEVVTMLNNKATVISLSRVEREQLGENRGSKNGSKGGSKGGNNGGSKGDKYQAYHTQQKAEPKKSSGKNGGGFKGTCFDCNQPGHKAGDPACKEPKKRGESNNNGSARSQAHNAEKGGSKESGKQSRNVEFDFVSKQKEYEDRLAAMEENLRKAQSFHTLAAYERALRFGDEEAQQQSDSRDYKYGLNMMTVSFKKLEEPEISEAVCGPANLEFSAEPSVTPSAFSPSVVPSCEPSVLPSAVSSAPMGVVAHCNMFNSDWRSKCKPSSGTPHHTSIATLVASRHSTVERLVPSETPSTPSVANDRKKLVSESPQASSTRLAFTGLQSPPISSGCSAAMQKRIEAALEKAATMQKSSPDRGSVSDELQEDPVQRAVLKPATPLVSFLPVGASAVAEEKENMDLPARADGLLHSAVEELGSDDDEGKAAGGATSGSVSIATRPVGVINKLNTRGGQYDTVLKTVASRRPVTGDAKKPSADQQQLHMLSSSKSAKPGSGRIFDTGATDNMRKSSEKMTEVKPMDPSVEARVYMGGNPDHSLPIVAIGKDGYQKDILVVPKILKDIISGPQLMKTNKLQMYLGERCFVYDLDSMKLVDSGTLASDNLVHQDEVPSGPDFESLISQLLANVKRKPVVNARRLVDNRVTAPHLTDKQFVFGSALNRPLSARAQVQNEWLILHNRCGHSHQQNLYNMVRNQTAAGLCVTLNELKRDTFGMCSWCLLGKFNKFPAPASFSLKPTSCMEVIRSDLEGPFRRQSCFGNKYFQLHEDPVSSYLWINFHRVKSAASDELRALADRVAAPLGLRIKVMQSDSDAIYKDQKLKGWADNNGVQLQYTAPYRHEGSIEARMKTVLEMMRTVIAESQLSEKYWEPIAEACVHTINRIPNSKFPASCAYTELFKKVPDISYFVPLGYPAVYKVYDAELRTTLEPKGEKCRVIGYAEDTPHSYRVVTESGRLLIRRDVIVDENFTVRRNQVGPTERNVLLIEPEPVPTVAVDDSVIASTSGAIRRQQPVVMPREPSTRVRRAPDRSSYSAESAVTKVVPALPPTPRNMKEAIADSNPHKVEWLRSINAEMKEMIDRQVIVPVQPGEKVSKPFRSKLAFRVTRQVNENLESVLKFKARMVALGFTSIFGVHYDDNYSPTVLFKALLVVLHLAALLGWYKTNIDIGNAYLEATAKKTLYMYLPEDWTEGRKIMVRLARNLYGLKDAGLLWYLLVNQVLIENGYKRSIFDPCIYFKEVNGELCVIALWVDDMAIFSNKPWLAEHFKAAAKKRFKKVSDMGELKKFIGIEVFQEADDRIVLKQLDMINEYVAEYVKAGRAIKYVPLSPVNEIDKVKVIGEDTSDYEPIWDITGKLRYLADRTRPDISYVAGRLGSCGAAAPPSYKEAAVDVMRYLNYSKDIGLKLGGRDKVVKAFAYADASHVRDRDSKSQLGYCIFLGRDSGAVVSRSIKDKTVSLSSTESEVKALVEAVKDIIWLRGLLNELGFPQIGPSVVYQDNESCIRLSEKVGSEAQTRHIINRLNFLRQEIGFGTIVLEKVASAEMVADILTGPRDRVTFEHLRAVLLWGHWYNKKGGEDA